MGIAFPSSLFGRIGIVEGSPPATIPEIQHQVPHELDIAVLDVDGRAQPPHILGHVVAEDDTPHGRLASAGFAHQQHLALLLPLARVHLD